MCFLRPLKVKKIEKNIAVLENGIKAFYDKKVGNLNINDSVLVYGNLIVRVLTNEKQSD